MTCDSVNRLRKESQCSQDWGSEWCHTHYTVSVTSSCSAPDPSTAQNFSKIPPKLCSTIAGLAGWALLCSGPNPCCLEDTWLLQCFPPHWAIPLLSFETHMETLRLLYSQQVEELTLHTSKCSHLSLKSGTAHILLRANAIKAHHKKQNLKFWALTPNPTLSISRYGLGLLTA